MPSAGRQVAKRLINCLIWRPHSVAAAASLAERAHGSRDLWHWARDRFCAADCSLALFTSLRLTTVAARRSRAFGLSGSVVRLGPVRIGRRTTPCARRRLIEVGSALIRTFDVQEGPAKLRPCLRPASGRSGSNDERPVD